ncbi:MAG: flippase-like domain-containing protein [SAR324 cluster bacterium]|uniref:Flippase-like domain-containing protein n=1 Tax=SAR324 cluster bacterium TaxID=2024889 RepID=A0A7X9FU02_9DELT|nr:flippase-like domain-containing protein [SAR324 cluster bacterium]
MSNFLRRYGIWIISVAALTFVISKLNWAAFLAQLAKVSILDILLLVIIYLLGFFPRALRSKLMLPALSWQAAMGGVMIGYAANNILPARLGELVRAHIIGKVEGIRTSTTLSSIVFERMLDGFVIVILLFIGSTQLALPGWAEEARWTGLALFSVALIIFLISGFFRSFCLRFVPEGRLGTFIEGVLEGAAIGCRNVPALLSIVALSFAVWFMEAVMFRYGFAIFDLRLGYLEALFVLGVLNLGILIPNSPGNIGVFQYFTILALSVFEIDASHATAYSVVLHLCQYVSVTCIGLFYLSLFGVRSLTDLRKDV